MSFCCDPIYYFLILELHNAEPWPSLGSNGGSCLKGSGIGVANLGINCWSHRQRGGFRTKLGTDEENRCPHRIIVIAQGGLHLRTYLCAGLGNLWFPTGCGKGLCTSRGICANPWRLGQASSWGNSLVRTTSELHHIAISLFILLFL